MDVMDRTDKLMEGQSQLNERKTTGHSQKSDG